ncbi:hypothetical protein VQH23_04305 [Pararoseomonas sp. SCSIO 73927]|uniref:hypothetical protein n=1 Tax=Pararoseomonas sp. SCSIO 73927 TaxID=3114537 RepID=UPI0030CEEE2E
MPPLPENRTPRCETRWIGGSILVLGGASLAVSGFDTPFAVLIRLAVAALIGLVLSFIFCPARARRGDGNGAGGDGDSGHEPDRHGERGRDGSDGDGDGGGDGGGGDGGGGGE